jgi:hypothetical protein
MGDPLSRLATRVAYAARQLPRMAWYAGHLYVMRRLAERQEGERDAASPKPEPDRRLDRRLEDDMMALVEQDLANVEAGIYPVPADHDGSSAGRTSISSSPTRRRSRRKTTVATP